MTTTITDPPRTRPAVKTLQANGSPWPNGSSPAPGVPGGELPNYCNDDFPVLSFLYALYCDDIFSKREADRWVVDRTYRGYLSNYVNRPKRFFPGEAMKVISDDVPGNPPEPNGRYKPTEDQSVDMILKYVMPELVYQASSGEAEPQPPITPAFFNASCPVLSCLGRIFINLESTFDPDAVPGITPEVRAVLKQTQWATNGRPFLTAKNVLILAPLLVDEFTRGNARW